MRITYLHQYFNTHEMPGSTRSFELARRLVDRGHEVNMITSWRGSTEGKGWFESEEDGIRVHWFPVPYSNAMSYSQRIGAFIRFATASARRAASIDCDVLYATSTPLTIVLPGAWAAWRLSMPMVFEVRDLWPDVPVALGVLRNRFMIWAAHKLERFAYRRSARIVVLTPTMRDFVSGKGVPLEKITALPNGADPTRFSAATATPEESDSRIELLYCGSLGPAHGPTYLCELAEAIDDADLPLRIVVAGDGGLLEELEDRSRESGCLGKTIEFIGAVPQQRVPELYSQAAGSLMTITDCELLYRHSVQNKFFDSLAAGVPVFANYSGWASDLAERAGAGVIVSRCDAGAAAAEIADRLLDTDWRARAGRSARSLSIQEFDYDLLAARLETVLESAAESRPNHSGALS